MALPIVAVVGRPNVGKSTFVNRITQTTDAIVHEARGVTRDRSYHHADWNGVDFLLIDTGGIESGKSADEFQSSIRSQALMAAEEADAIVFIVDGKAGLTPEDEEVARILKRAGRPTFLAVNKMDTPGRDDETHEFWALGLGHAVARLGDARPRHRRPPRRAREGAAADGRAEDRRPAPSTSPSSAARTPASPRCSTSSPASSARSSRTSRARRATPSTWRSSATASRYRLIDTAGIRRKSLIDEDVEYYGFVRAMRAIDRAQVALLVIDATIGLTDQDQRVANFAAERGCAMVVLLNKWDVLETAEEKEAIDVRVEERLGFVGYAPVLKISALTGRGVSRIWDAVDVAFANYIQEIPTSQLNKLLTEMREFGHTVSKGKQTLRLHYVTQTRTSPPGFTFFANHPTLVDDNFKRYLENRLRERFELTGTPIILKFRKKD